MEHSSEEGFRHIPFRLYVPDLTSKPFLQFLMKPFENDKKNTLGDLLHKVNLNLESKGKLRSLFPSNSLINSFRFFFAGTFQVVTHGIDVSLETPLQWMSEHLSYPDNFLHLCIRYPPT